MDWILDHLWVLLAAAGAIAQMLIKSKSQGKEDTEAPPQEKNSEEQRLADQTRRIREEIQRKIVQRRRGAASLERQSESVAEPDPEMERDVPPLVQQIFTTPRQAREMTSHVEAQHQAEILERQATLAEQLAQAVAMKASLLKRTTFETNISESDATNDRSRRALVGELRDPAALRRAFVLREILGPPVALR